MKKTRDARKAIETIKAFDDAWNGYHVTSRESMLVGMVDEEFETLMEALDSATDQLRIAYDRLRRP